MLKRNAIVVIPAYEPKEKLVGYVEELFAKGFDWILVVDDGSGEAYRDIFWKLEDLGAFVLHHETNKGKGQALRTGFSYVRKHFGYRYPVITADCDGQHLAEDVVKVDEKVGRYPDRLILGTRDFSGSEVPFKSKSGNRITSKFFKLSTGIDCPDTQTGLRGIPSSMLDFALQVKGDRYEYEMNFLTDAAGMVAFYCQPIATVYEDGNAGTHFRPVRDSLLIYKKPIRFAISSLTGAVVDFLLFYLFEQVFFYKIATKILFATVGARLCSGLVNFLMNKHFCFESNGSATKEGTKYFLLFVGQMILSACGVTILSWFMPDLLAKAIVDTVLFVISYIIQKRWVFRIESAEEEGRLSAPEDMM